MSHLRGEGEFFYGQANIAMEGGQSCWVLLRVAVERGSLLVSVFP